MIKFRQKDFALPALLAPLFTANGLMASTMIGGTAISAVQGHKAAKASEEQHEQMLAAQKRENAKLTKALNNLAEQAKNNPQAAIQAGQMVGQSRMYSVPSNGFIGNVIKFGKDIASASHLTGKGGKKLLGLGTAGVLTAGVGYGVDKSITHDARKIGLMPENRSVEKAYSSVLSQVGAYAKKAGKYIISKDNLKSNAGFAAFAAIPAVGYIAQRKQYKDQISNTQPQSQQDNQKTYSVMSTLGNTIKNTWKGATKNWKGWQTVTGAAAKAGSFFTVGRREVQQFGKNLQGSGMGTWANKVGKFIENNPNTANLAVGVGGGSLIAGAYNQGEKLTKKGIKAIDKDAFAYEKFSNK